MSEVKNTLGSVPNFDIEDFIEDDGNLIIPNPENCYEAINLCVNSHDKLKEQNEKMYEMLEKIAKSTVHDKSYAAAKPIFDLLKQVRGE